MKYLIFIYYKMLSRLPFNWFICFTLNKNLKGMYLKCLIRLYYDKLIYNKLLLQF